MNSLGWRYTERSAVRQNTRFGPASVGPDGSSSFSGKHINMSGTQVIGIASGKGGVGKTSVSVNLAVALTMRGKKVMLFDADLGLANAQILLGCPTEFNFSHVLSGQKTLRDIVVTTRQGVRFVPGASGMHQMAALGTNEAAAIVQAFSSLDEDIDYLIVDVAAGISSSVLTFMQAVQRRFIVVNDEPSSIADAYGTIKVLSRECELDEIYLVPNRVESQAVGENLYRRLNDVCRRFLGKSVGYVHTVTADSHMLEAVRAYKSVLDFAPGGNAARDFRQLAAATEALAPTDEASGSIQFFVERLIGAQKVG